MLTSIPEEKGRYHRSYTANIVLGFFQPELEAGLSGFFSAVTDDMIADLPPYEP
jgi:hypothetical protein